MEKNKYYDTVCALVIVIATFMFATLMFNSNVWYDEAYSLAMIKHGFGDILKITAEDVHPPLYYFGLKLFCSLGGDVLIMSKIFSIIPLVLMMIMGYFQLGKMFDKKTALAFVMMVALMPLYHSFSVEIRMYTWASLSVFGCGIFAYRAIKENKMRYYVYYGLFGVMSAYLHYFAFVSVLVVYGIAFVAAIRRKNLKPWLVCSGASLVAYLPWMSSFVMQLGEKVTNEYWIAPITPEVVKGYFDVWLICGNHTAQFKTAFAVLFVICILALIFTKSKNRGKAMIGGAGVFLGTCVIGIVASLLIRPVFIERYAIPAIPLVLAGMALSVGVIKSKMLIALMCVLGICANMANYPIAYDIEYNSSEKNIKNIIENSEADALVCFVDAHLYGVLSHYGEEKTVYRPKLSKGSPFENIKELSNRDIEKEDTILIFVGEGEEVPKEGSEGYSISYHCKVNTYGVTSDVYLGTR